MYYLINYTNWLVVGNFLNCIHYVFKKFQSTAGVQDNAAVERSSRDDRQMITDIYL